MTVRNTAPRDLMTVEDLAREFDMGKSTVWLMLKRHAVQRYRIPALGKTTLVSRGEFERLAMTPIPVNPPAKKAVA